MTTEAPPPFQARRRPQPSVEMSSRELISFFHPGYELPVPLLTLPRVDGAHPTYGVHHRTALLACQIIAGNAFRGSRLAFDRLGQQPTEVALDGILVDPKYYFIVDGEDVYPIVPSFQDWQFPHDYVRDFWPEVPPSTTSTTTCGITNDNYAIDGAHLVPQTERAWYIDNSMSVYGTDFQDIDNQANIIPLRKDIHYCFDNRWWVVTPKPSKVENGSAAPSTQYVSHIITRDAAGLWPTHHNILVESIQSCSRPYLFARFAWAILFKVKLFVINSHSLNVIRVHRGIEGSVTYKAENCTRAVLTTEYGGGGSRAASSKRKRSEQTKDEENFEEFPSAGSDTSTDEMDDFLDDWGGRGRRRKQVSSGETAPDLKARLAPDVEGTLRGALCKSKENRVVVKSLY